MDRILMTADTVGGVWTYSLELIRALRDYAGVEVTLAAMGGPLSSEERCKAAAICDLFESEYKLEWMNDPWDDVRRAGDWLLDIEARVRPELVHLNSFGNGALAWSAPTVVVAHSCVLSWWQAVKGEAAPPEWGHYKAIVSRSLANADAVVAPSRSMLASLRRSYDFLGDGTVIPNARDPRFFRAAPRKEEFILSAGRLWDEAKNISALDAIAAELPWPVYVAGETRHPDRGAAAFGNAHSLGCLSAGELAGWYARAPIYALPARYEPFGLSAVEAALSGCTLVLGDIDSLREIWGEAAVYAPPGELEQLSAAINQLISDPARRSAFAGRAYRRALEFSPERMAGAYVALYRNAARKVILEPCAS